MRRTKKFAILTSSWTPPAGRAAGRAGRMAETLAAGNRPAGAPAMDRIARIAEPPSLQAIPGRSVSNRSGLCR